MQLPRGYLRFISQRLCCARLFISGGFLPPRSAFLFFCQDKRPAIKAKNPGYTIGNVAKVLGKDWKALGEDDRKPYEEKAGKDRARYEREKRDYAPGGREEDEEEEEEDDEYED